MFNLIKKPQVNFSKYLQVNAPKSIKKGDAGYDLHVPDFTEDFWEKFKSLNKIRKSEVIFQHEHLLQITSCYNDIFYVEFFTNSFEDYFESEINHVLKSPEVINDKFVVKVLKFIKSEFYENPNILDENIILSFKNRFLIPSGLMIDYPKNYYGEMVNRSSNFKNNINVNISYCDNNFVLPGNIFQINRIDNHSPIVITAGQRIGQMLLRRYWKLNWNFLNNRLFNNRKQVINKKKERDGGLGSSGK